MAAITTDGTFRFETLKMQVANNLPHYARPLFVRLCAEIPVTGTFKLTKGSLVRDGLTPSEPGDTIWVYDQGIGDYVRFDGTSDPQRLGWPAPPPSLIEPPVSP